MRYVFYNKMLEGAYMQSSQIIISVIIIFIIWALIERKLIATARYIITSARFPKLTKATRFVLLADLHNGTFGKNNVRLVKRIDILAPDYILVAGDMINKKEIAYPSNAYTLLESLAKKYKIYYAYGNHEQRMEQYGGVKPINQSSLDMEKLYSTWIEYKERLSSLGIIFLNNESISDVKNGVNFSFTGISIAPAYFERNSMSAMQTAYLKDLVCANPHGQVSILIAHNPFYYKNYLEWGADLVVSGHFHGGMVRLPGLGGMISPQADFFPKYDAGKYTDHDQSMVVSRGLGSHSIMPRMFNAPDLVYIDFVNEA